MSDIYTLCRQIVNPGHRFWTVPDLGAQVMLDEVNNNDKCARLRHNDSGFVKVW